MWKKKKIGRKIELEFDNNVDNRLLQVEIGKINITNEYFAMIRIYKWGFWIGYSPTAFGEGK